MKNLILDLVGALLVRKPHNDLLSMMTTKLHTENQKIPTSGSGQKLWTNLQTDKKANDQTDKQPHGQVISLRGPSLHGSNIRFLALWC